MSVVLRKGLGISWLAAAGVGAIILLAAACGGGGATPTPTPIPTPTPTPEPCPVATPPPAVEGGATITQKQYSAPPPLTIDVDKRFCATIHTNRGSMTLELLPKEAPVTVNNFVFLAREGYYDGVIFHRVIESFMIQGGDPTGTGRGGPGYRFDDEPVTRDYLRGTLAMANAGRNTNGSQFFIIHRDYPLPKSYTIFGMLTEGAETLDAIATTAVTGPQNSSPVEPQVIESIVIEELDAG